MLILSRKLNEKVVIGGGITVQIVEIRGSKVRLGIEAPPNTSVDREEIAREKNQLRRLSGGQL